MIRYSVMLNTGVYGSPTILADRVLWDSTYLTFQQGDTIVARFASGCVLGYQVIANTD